MQSKIRKLIEGLKLQQLLVKISSFKMYPVYDMLNRWIDTTIFAHPKILQIFNKLETSSHVSKHKIFNGLVLVFFLYMAFGAFAQLICNVVGYVYPAIQSLEALETVDHEDDRKWLTYWVVFASFSIIEFYSDQIFHVFPFYCLVKVIFLVWAFWPTENNGSIYIYNNFIRPFYLEKRKHADKDTETSKIDKSRPNPQGFPNLKSREDNESSKAVKLMKKKSREKNRSKESLEKVTKGTDDDDIDD